ncbi:cell division FtsZ family protein [Candidatus Aerophobetes bacterium]|nr:cell division FtsZ family protein [Candidatus Aerophobetes bacterium]
MIEFEPDSSSLLSSPCTKESSSIRIKVLGVGGAGCNILSRLRCSSLNEIKFIALDTDRKNLAECKRKKIVQLGENISGGWGTGGDPEIGRQIALEEKSRLKKILEDADLLLLISGLGKGTGTGISPVTVQLAKEMNKLVLALVIFPFYFEGDEKLSKAKKGLQELEKVADALMVVYNDDLLKEKDISLKEGLKKIDGVLESTVRAISGLFFHPSLIGMGLDFADIKSFLKKRGYMQVAVGKGKGKEAAINALKEAIPSPMQHKVSFEKTKGIILNIRGGKNLLLSQVEKAASLVKRGISREVEFFWGVSVDENLSDEVSLTLITLNSQMHSKREKEEKRKPSQGELNLKIYEDDDLDIPTFLRKREN